MAIGLYSTLGGLEFAEGLAETDPPFLSGQVPAPSATGISVLADITFTVDDLDAGVLLGLVIVTVNVGGGPVVAYTSSAFQAGFSGSVTPVGFGYAFVVNPAAVFSYFTTISVRVQAEDADGNTLDVTYTFQTEQQAIEFGTDTIRGGLFFVLPNRGELLLNTSRDQSFVGLALPMGWTSVSTGSGVPAPTMAGLVLDSGRAVSSVAGVESPDDYDRFDVQVDVALVHPTGTTGAAVDLAVLEAFGGGGSSARVRLRRGVGAEPELTVAYGDLTPASGPVLVGGLAAAPTALVVSLRLVRNLERVLGFVGVRDGSYVKVLDFDRFETAPGRIQIYLANGSYAGRVRTVVSNFTVRSHGSIGPRLLENKLDVGPLRIAGNVPAATLEEVGLTDITVFGLFGELMFGNAFRYTLPAEKTLGRASTRTFFTVQDPVLRDGTE